MKTFINKGDAVSFTAPSGGVVSGTPVLIGSLLVVPNATVAQGLKFAGETNGCFSGPKADSQAWTEGVKIYWDNTAKNFTTTSSANTLVGVAIEAVAATTGLIVGKVRLDGVAR